MAAPLPLALEPLQAEVWYVWREMNTEEDGMRYLVPRSNPHEYEDDMDYYFETPEKAVQFLTEMEIEPDEYDDWVLCKVTIDPLPVGKWAAYLSKKTYREDEE